METDLAVAVIAGGVSLGVAAIGFFHRGEIRKLNHARRLERERSFEQAQTGYRALYRKFANHYENASSAGAEMDSKVRRDFYEAQTCRRSGHSMMPWTDSGPGSANCWDAAVERTLGCRGRGVSGARSPNTRRLGEPTGSPARQVLRHFECDRTLGSRLTASVVREGFHTSRRLRSVGS